MWERIRGNGPSILLHLPRTKKMKPTFMRSPKFDAPSPRLPSTRHLQLYALEHH